MKLQMGKSCNTRKKTNKAYSDTKLRKQAKEVIVFLERTHGPTQPVFGSNNKQLKEESLENWQ